MRPPIKLHHSNLLIYRLSSGLQKSENQSLMSTGMATEDEILEAITTARSAGCENILIFHCISSYPAPIEQANLRKILNLKDKFGVEVWVTSDHTIGNVAAVTSVALGATAIEKHLPISRDDKGPDSEFSIEPDELRKLVDDTKNAWLSLWRRWIFRRPETERSSAIFRRHSISLRM